MHAILQGFTVERGVCGLWRLRRDIFTHHSSVEELRRRTRSRIENTVKEFTLPNRYDILRHPGQHERLRAAYAEVHAIELDNHLLLCMPRTNDESL